MVKNSKPDPEIYQNAVDALGLKAEECVAVEDSLNGLKSAKRAGLYTIMVPDRVAPNEETALVSDYVFKSLKDITENDW